MAPGKARIKDIALKAGVSIGTVDRVLHDRGEVAEETKRKILQIARELDYTPDFMARALKTRKNLRLLSLLPSPSGDNDFWSKHPHGIKRALDELDPYSLTLDQINFDIRSERDFQKKTSEVLAFHPDGVILAPIFKNESITFCKKLTNENIPFVFIDGFIKETNFLCYTGEDIFQSGRVAGQLIDLITPPEKDILVINIARNLQNIHHLNIRTEGFMSYFPDKGKNKGRKISMNIPDLDAASIGEATGKDFFRKNNIGSIFITGSKSFRIAEYLESEAINSMSIVGYDLLERNVRYLKEGRIKFLIGQRPEEQIYKGIKKLFEFLSLKKIPEKIEYLPIDVVTSENVDFFTKQN
jgi:LacI family transcriptional regulator